MAVSSIAPSPLTVVKSIALVIATLLLMSFPAQGQGRLYDGVLISKAGVAPSVIDVVLRIEGPGMSAKRLTPNLYHVFDNHRVRRSGKGEPMNFAKAKNGCKNKRVARLVKKLRAQGARYSCSLNHEQRVNATTSNDPFMSILWGLHSSNNVADMNAPEAWDTTTGSSNVVIGVIDTGIQYNHPDLIDNMWVNPGEIPGNNIDDDGNGIIDDVYGYNGITNSGNPMDDQGHGTHVAGTIGAKGNNATGVVGVNWNVKMMALKFLNSSGSGSTADAIKCLNYANSKGVRITNNSWGGGGYNQALKDAIDVSASLGYLFVAAAGNSNQNIDSSPAYPAAYNSSNILSIAAVDVNGNRASFSNYGAGNVDIGAPGVQIGSTYPTNQYVYLDGTSMAAPHAAGLAGLLLACNSGLNAAQMKAAIMNTGRSLGSLSGVTVTGKTIDAAAALASISCGDGGDGGGGGGSPQPEPEPTPEPTPPPATSLTVNDHLYSGQFGELQLGVTTAGRYTIQFTGMNGQSCRAAVNLRVGPGAIQLGSTTNATLRFRLPPRSGNVSEVGFKAVKLGVTEAMANASVEPGSKGLAHLRWCSQLALSFKLISVNRVQH